MRNKKLKKIISVILLAAMFTAVLTSCGKTKPDEKRYAFLTNKEGAENERVAQAWSGTKQAAAQKPCQATIYTPENDSDEEKDKILKGAVGDGARVVISLGEDMRNTIYAGQSKNKKTKFVLIDSEPEKKDGADNIPKNMCIVHLDEEEAGYLCGYALVMEGYKNLGFMGGYADEREKRFANGFIKGAQQAGVETAMPGKDIKVIMTYTGDDKLDPRKMDKALSWYKSGIEVIFAPDTDVRKSVERAAVSRGKVCGIAYKNQDGYTNEQVMFAVMDYESAVQTVLRDFEEDIFKGESTVKFGAIDGCVRIDADYSKFRVVNETMNSLAVNNLRNGVVTIPEGDATSGTTHVEVIKE